MVSGHLKSAPKLVLIKTKVFNFLDSNFLCTKKLIYNKYIFKKIQIANNE